jgi:hypothetical protein
MAMSKTEQGIQIQVVFKAPGGGEDAEYGYLFSEAQGVAIFDQLRRSPHPYGSVLYPSVIQAGIPYYPLSRG